jgi:hypothetical protein
MNAQDTQQGAHHPHSEDAGHTAHARTETGQLIIFKG